MINMTENNEEYLMDDTDIVIDDVTVQTVETPVFEFTLSNKTHLDYRCCVAIIEWIKQNLDDLTDDNDDPVFSKVNYGYNSETLKGFNKKPVADVYLNNLEYSDTFDNNKPEHVNSFIICSFKGNMNYTYVKVCELVDFLIQQFNENESFRELDGVVRATSITDVGFEIIPSGKTYGLLCTFELQHELY